MKKKTLRWLAVCGLCFGIVFGGGCASCQRELKSCSADINGGLYRIINVYSLDGKLLATYEGKVDIDDNANGSIMFELDGKRYVYYNAIVEVVQK